ncbi:BRO family protein [Citrobacter freundii]|uniref:BRO-N domain-containing protein n=1 Tax=Enterobacteriaceae TaxID=543 RepID=UPI0009AA82AD|nr:MULTISPECIES: BRO family protein [Enterobacteriaceae]EAV6124182.1 BRO-like protein [Salmonella enterica subsp. enterica serovar Anatum]EBH9986692.1 BRO-like protein [Salmonella enterica subsp. enterica serovar Amager]EAO9626497.1 BRO-like protein [Salmonella enterica]EAV5172888.1 BRO-like protein [Salmonella enterica]EBI0494311.1 BRO-like protein [Salmonella enterica subsp. enterica serovar Amager]
MNTNPSVFSFESACNIRMFMIDGEPWFVTKDVCDALNIDVTQARKLDKRGWNKKGLYSIQTLGGKQELSVVSESGLYIIMLRCKEAMTEGTRAFRFLEWVTGEVLPQIRRTGRYVREELSPADKAQKVVASFMPAILEAMKTGEKQEYSAPLKPNYREHIHSPEGVLGLTERSMLMDLLRKMDADGHDVEGAVAEFTAMMSYIVGASKCLRDIQTHTQYINSMAGKF